MTQPVADAAVRREALDPRRSFIVQAPAGSGKTELLIQRFLVLLATVEHPESVVAITFTRKAAGEMRFRLVEALQRAASDEPPAQEHARFTWERARAALARDREQEWKLLENPARLRILTIDALCLNLVRQMPWLSRLGAPPRPEENPQAIYREAARATLDLVEGDHDRAASLAVLLSHLDNNYGLAERLLMGMLARRDQWLRPLMAARLSAADGGQDGVEGLRELMEQQLQAIVQSAMSGARQALMELDHAGDMVELSAWAAANLAEDAQATSPLLACDGMTELPGDDPAELPQWLGLATLFLTGEGERRQRVDKRVGFPAGEKSKLRKGQFQNVDLQPPEAALLHNLRSLPPTRFDDRQWQVLAALFEVLPIAVVQLRAAFQRAGAVDFIEVAQAARLALGPADSPSDLAFALDYRIQHWLVDEFQDTSHSQFALLEALTAEWQRDDGRTVFLVGDPMQSIYAFRQAEVGLFLQARQRGLGPLPLTPLQLTVNFRSQAGLVEWVNETFCEAFPPVEDIARGAVTFESSLAFHPSIEGAAVTVHAFPGRNYRLEAERVLELIRRSRNDNPSGTVAVLVRSRSHLVDLVQLLQQAGMRYRAVEIDPLRERPVVQDLMALTRALLHAADRPAWLAVLRAPWCGLKLAELLAVAGGDRNAAVQDLLQRAEVLAALPDDARQRLQRVTGVLERAVPLAGRMPLARLVEKTWIELGGPACLDDRSAAEDAEAYLHLLEDCAPGADVDLDDLITRMDRLFAQPDPDADETLQLMTLHKSKGLEFDTVILPGLGRMPRNEDSSLLLWMDESVLPGHIAPLLAPIKEAGAERDALYRWVQSEQNLKRDFEVTRLLYVAVTRARQRLHLLAHCGISQKTGEVNRADRRTLLGRIWPQVEAEVRGQIAEQMQAAAEPAAGEEMTPARGVPLRRLPVDWRPPAPPPVLNWRPEMAPVVLRPDDAPSVVEEPLTRALNAVLRLMLRQEGHIADEAAARALLRAEGVTSAQIEAAVDDLLGAMRRIEADERGGWLRAGGMAAEWGLRLSGELDGKLVQTTIDRSFIDEDGARWLIAVRMGRWERRAAPALMDADAVRCLDCLEASARLLRSADATHPVRIAVYFPWMCAWREWPATQGAGA